MTTYWAELDATNIVVQVITGVDDPIIEGVSAEQWYTNFVGETCKQTYIDTVGKNYAGIGYTYDVVNNNFISPQPYPSWLLDASHNWQAPTVYPSDGKVYVWDETSLTWILKN